VWQHVRYWKGQGANFSRRILWKHPLKCNTLASLCLQNCVLALVSWKHAWMPTGEHTYSSSQVIVIFGQSLRKKYQMWTLSCQLHISEKGQGKNNVWGYRSCCIILFFHRTTNLGSCLINSFLFKSSLGMTFNAQSFPVL
jgi:hypothetical protein